MEANVIDSPKTRGRWFCCECGRPINEGYVYRGRCVVCAEKYLNPEKPHRDNR